MVENVWFKQLHAFSRSFMLEIELVPIFQCFMEWLSVCVRGGSCFLGRSIWILSDGSDMQRFYAILILCCRSTGLGHQLLAGRSTGRHPMATETGAPVALWISVSTARLAPKHTMEGVEPRYFCTAWSIDIDIERLGLVSLMATLLQQSVLKVA